MPSRWLPALVTVIGVAAAWAATRSAGFAPLLWVVLMGAILGLPVADRRVLDRGWLAAGGLLLALSWVVAADHELALRHTLVALAAALLFALARRASPDDRLIAVLALGVALTSLVAFSQALGGMERALSLVTTLPRGWHEAAAARLAGGRVFGTSALPGHFAALMLLAAPLVVEQVRRTTRWLRLGWCTALVAIVGATLLTRSLAALLVAGALLVALATRGTARLRLLVVAAVLVVLAAVVVSLRGDVPRLEPVRLRWVNWRTAAWVFAHHPFLGVGLGGVGQAGLLAPTAAANITPYAHNTYLQFLAEFGLAGAAVLGAGVWELQRLVRRGFAVAPGLALAVAAVPLHNVVDFSAYAPEVVLPWAVLAGTLAARTCAPPLRPVRGGVLLAIASVAAVLATLWWRGEVEMDSAASRPAAQAWKPALASAAWTPWAVTPLELAAGAAIEGGAPAGALASLDARLAERGWVMPHSASWAETRSRLLLAQGMRGEALGWAREARRRAPWRRDLDGLEAACAAP